MTTDNPGVSSGVNLAFRIGLFAQALLGLAQFASGVVLKLSPQGAILRLVDWFTRNEIVDDPQSQVVQLITGWASKVSAQGEGFYVYYLLGHGALNVFAAVALYRHWRGSYPLSMVVLGLFMIFQMWEFFHTYDPMLLVLTAIDVVVICVITIEERQRAQRTTA